MVAVVVERGGASDEEEGVRSRRAESLAKPERWPELAQKSGTEDQDHRLRHIDENR